MRSLILLVALALGGPAGCSSRASEPPGSHAPTATGPAPRAPDGEPADGPAFTVASYNINAGMSGNRQTLAALRALDGADVILIQEVSSQWKRLLAAEWWESHPYRSTHVANGGYGGLAIASRFPIRASAVLPASAGSFPAWRGTIDAPGGMVQLVNVHLFPPGLRARSRGWIRAYAESQEVHVRELASHWPSLAPELPTIVAGDFNENGLGRAIGWLRARGFAPAHTDGAPTWRWEMRGVPIEFQLDHIMVRGLEVVAADVRRVGDSDHLPIVATLRRVAATAR